MKKVKYMVAGMIVLVMLMAGCGSEFAGGAVAGAAATGAVTGVTAAMEQQRAEYQARYEIALAKLGAATTDAEKQVAQADVDKSAVKLSLVTAAIAAAAGGLGWGTRYLGVKQTPPKTS